MRARAFRRRRDPPGRAGERPAELERMGATFANLGQVLSNRPDLLTPPYLEALSRLQDRVEPSSGAEAERIVEEELGVRLSQAFQAFEGEPIAPASLGQVHRAVLRDGREVAVKVQRPGLRESVHDDLVALEDLAEAVDHHTEAGRRYAFSEMRGGGGRGERPVRRIRLRKASPQRLRGTRLAASAGRLVIPAHARLESPGKPVEVASAGAVGSPRGVDKQVIQRGGPMPTERDEERIRPEETEPGRPSPQPEERDLPDGGDPRESDWRDPGPEKDPGPPETPGRERPEQG